MEALVFWGEYDGIQYPQGYTQEEKAVIMPVLDSNRGEGQIAPREVKGKLCMAGKTHAIIKPDGSVYRCNGNRPRLIGSLFSSDFELLNEPLPCESEFCPCNEWSMLLLDNKKRPAYRSWLGWDKKGYRAQ